MEHQRPFAIPLCLRVACLAIVACPFLGLAQTPGASDAASDKATLQALLLEVHQLRLALERSTALVPRIQIAAQRLQAEQDRIDRLSRELRDLHGQMAQHAADKERTSAALKRIDEELGQNPEQAHRKELEEAAGQIKFEAAHQTSREQQERTLEVDLLAQIQTEQTALNDLTEQLNALSKKLEQQ